MELPELPKNVPIAWRRFAGSSEFDTGVNFLLRHHAPRASGKTVGEITEAALKWAGYVEALDDLTRILCEVKAKEVSIDQPGLIETRGGDND